MAFKTAVILIAGPQDPEERFSLIHTVHHFTHVKWLNEQNLGSYIE